MGGYHKFLSLTLQRWRRFVLVQNLSPLAPKEALETYFSQHGPVEGVRLIHDPEKGGCYTRKALVLMKSEVAAARIIEKKCHPFGPDGCITTVDYRGSVQKYKKGRFKVFLMLPLPVIQDSVETRTKTGAELTAMIARAYNGILFTSIKLDVDEKDYYNGIATVRFEFEFDEARVLHRTREKLETVALWKDTKAEGYCGWECRQKVLDDYEERVADWGWGLDDNDDAWLPKV